MYSRYRMSPALHWHLHLLGQLLGEFYMAKLREAQLREQSYLQAVHETGARMTHDIKNLLQSLNVLCAAAVQDSARNSADSQALIRRQLPVIAQRLSATLDKLQRPQDTGESYAAAGAWWEHLARQYRGEGVEFELGRFASDTRVPRTLFDSVADNLIRNALAKRATDGHVRVRVSLDCAERVRLRVRDSGRPVPADVEKNLFRGPVPSTGGLGIGLYQAARQAEAGGYVLELESNREDDVCFTLSGPPA
jgi:signal transduction histidine kinase